MKKRKNEKGSNPKLWSDGEHRIIDEIFSLNNTVRFCLSSGEQILFKSNVMALPRVDDIINIKFIVHSDNKELEFVSKLFKEKIIEKYQLSQEFSFKVERIIHDFNDSDESAGSEPEHVVIIKPSKKEKFIIKHLYSLD